jgi:uncharacterized SAM-dependent methyltransferase
MSDWLNQNLIQQTIHYITTINQIPDYIGYYSPHIVKGLLSINEHKLLPSKSNRILHLEKELLHQSADRIALRFQNYSKINLLAVSEVSIEFAAPLLYEFAKTKSLSAYTSVTPNILLNDFNVKQVQEYLSDFKFENIALKKIQTEPELESCKNEIQNIEKELDLEINIFLVLGSRLGNSPDPQRMLKNIAKSMNPGDHLIILQGILNEYNKELLLNDYQEVLLEDIYKKNDDDIISRITSDFVKSVQWFNQNQFQGVELSIKLNNDEHFHSLSLSKGQEISIFRSIRFDPSQLEKMISGEDLSMINISYDTDKNFGLYIAKKTS